MINVKLDNYEYSYIDIKYEIDVHPSIEVYRYKLHNEIVNKIMEILNSNKITLKSTYKDTERNVRLFLSSFIFSKFAKKIHSLVDGFFPYNIEDQNSFIKDLQVSASSSVSNVKINLKKLFNEAISKLKNHSITNIKYIKKEIKNHYYNFIYENISLDIPIEVYQKLQNRYIEYNDKSKKFDDLVFCILLRYETLSSYNHQLAMRREVKNAFYNIMDIDFECFASSLNHQYTNYCSLFYDIEKYFMSKGFFHNIEFKQGFYMINPPYDIDMLKNLAIKTTSAFSTKKDLSFMIGLPKWESNELYGNFDAIDIIENSDNFVKTIEIPKGSVLWYNFLTRKNIKIPTHLVCILTNGKKSISNLISYIINNYWIYDKFNFNPIINIKEYYASEKIKIKVIRDDYLIGGTKQRGLVDFMKTIKNKNINYASSNPGHAQIALSFCGQYLNKNIIIHITKQRPLTIQSCVALEYGATLKEYNNKSLKELQQYCELQNYCVPLGIGVDEFKESMYKKIKQAINGILIKSEKYRFWIIGGSGTILSIMYKVFPNSFFNIVQVGKKIWPDQLEEKRSKLYIADEKFNNKANIKPPYSSNMMYDAKIWQFVLKYGLNDDIIWNIA